ncbi:S26 family signal peptidase [Kitasatospora cathayae]|uniref:S26 family signal peptidase n=1 Tax=Kitasatospora cathayae TaxID=3004092 RepID=A0ABY7QF61_9ACTN|nr:S26 family signal peptidase [Kitasatospora sp. HUAS 3-15]WBP91398.1 S26 family signal peptidase [Kitasatospora sp. HUAS 3-15]
MIAHLSLADRRLLMAGGLVTSALAGAAMLNRLRKRLYLVTVKGWSMQPTLMPGDRLLVAGPSGRPCRPGDIVIAQKPTARDWAGAMPTDSLGDRGQWIVKRVAAVSGDRLPVSLAGSTGLLDVTVVPDGSVVLVGDDQYSEDSRQWGLCPQHLVIGRVLFRVTRGPELPDPYRLWRATTHGREVTSMQNEDEHTQRNNVLPGEEAGLVEIRMLDRIETAELKATECYVRARTEAAGGVEEAPPAPFERSASDERGLWACR